MGFQSSLASAEGGTFIVPLPTTLPPGPKEWQADLEHLPAGQAGLSVLLYKPELCNGGKENGCWPRVSRGLTESWGGVTSYA